MLTDKRLKAIKPRESIYELADRDGLSVRVSPGGTITFQYRYRINGKAERFSYGKYPDMSLAEARDHHEQARRLVGRGLSPARERAIQRAAQERNRREATGADTVHALCEEFMTRYIERERKRPESARQMLVTDVLPALGAMKVNEVSRRDVVEMLDRIVDRGSPVQANRTASLVKQMFQFAVERGIIDASPCADIRRQTVGGTEKSRSRSLNEAEIAAVWRGLTELCEAKSTVRPAPNRKLVPEERKQAWISKPMATALKLLLVTGQRRGELVYARWTEVDLEAALWTIPAENTKNGRLHEVPLSELAVALFTELRAYAGSSAYVLPRYDGLAPITERALTKAAERARPFIGTTEGHTLQPLPHWTPHDLRRTVATQLAELGVLPHVVEKVLNHTMQGVMGVYNRHRYVEEQRHALSAWAERLKAIVRA